MTALDKYNNDDDENEMNYIKLTMPWKIQKIYKTFIIPFYFIYKDMILLSTKMIKNIFFLSVQCNTLNFKLTKNNILFKIKTIVVIKWMKGKKYVQ